MDSEALLAVLFVFLGICTALAFCLGVKVGAQ